MRGLLLAALAAVAGCGGKSDESHVAVAGSTAFAPTAEKLAKAYTSKNQGVRIDIQSNGSAAGIAAANDGQADIGMADIPELPAEAKSLKATVVARDGIAVVVHPSNPVKDLTLAQVALVFTGRVKSWKEVGGDDRPLDYIVREPGSGTRKSFEKLVGIKSPQEAKAMDSNGSCRAQVASNPNAVSYVSISLVDASVKSVSIDGAAPTNANVISGSYKIARPVYFLTKSDVKPVAQKFIDYILSDEGQKLIVTEGLIPAK